MEDIKKHTRVNQTVMGPLERPALQWLAAHSPTWITPDVLTSIGVLGSVMCFVGYCLSGHDVAWLWLVNLGFLVNWYGDSLDGTLARFRKIERPKFGFYIDHTVDAVTEFLTIIGIGMSPYLRLDIAAFAMIGYLLMSVHVYIRTAVEGVFKISFGDPWAYRDETHRRARQHRHHHRRAVVHAAARRESASFRYHRHHPRLRARRRLVGTSLQHAVRLAREGE